MNESPTSDTSDTGRDVDVRAQHWFHTSTQPDWPSEAWDPGARLDAAAESRMRRLLPAGRFERWQEEQRRKLLHIGTLTSALENMERRRRNQADENSKFWLYRVRLKPDVSVRSGVRADPGGLVGDVLPEKVLTEHESILRYANAHEDRGSISLALRRCAIAAVQRMPIPDAYNEPALMQALDSAEWEDR
ncbi:hypothetical protein ACFWHR_09325 [Leucobacter sp. NPDC058333]|uniref:hypothetical protein n=1 Tax=Leucobacter sp. NPDC058333 TaxID=3346450 RepID=UPI00366781B6